MRVLRRRLLAGLGLALLEGRLVDLVGYPLINGGLNQPPRALVDRRGADGPRADDALLQGPRRTPAPLARRLGFEVDGALAALGVALRKGVRSPTSVTSSSSLRERNSDARHDA